CARWTFQPATLPLRTRRCNSSRSSAVSFRTYFLGTITLPDIPVRSGQGGDFTRKSRSDALLVGDSGVGKTGLGWRLAHRAYKEQDSTHGQQFWVLDQWKHRRGDGAECEAVLWDLAGQPDYRLIHTLFLDDADLALVLFNPANRQEPL